MTKLIVLLAVALIAGCTSAQCDKVRPYQETVAGGPIRVPADLNEPGMRSRAPDVEPNAPTTRADGRCLEDPPEYIAETEEPEPEPDKQDE